MRDNELSDKIKIKALLDTYSVNEISNKFSHIDNNLMSLHECSADDFIQLSTDFKNLYKQSEIISGNVNSIFEIISANKNKNLYHEIHSFYEKLKKQAEAFCQKFTITMEFLESLSLQLRFVFFPIKNFGQNLMSLKYLLANLNLSLAISDNSSEFIEQFKLIDKNITDLKLHSESISKNFNHLLKISKTTCLNFSEVKNQNIINIEALLLSTKSRIHSIEKQFSSNKKCVPKIREKTNKSTESINDIITKLQYQDIIRQKMEHIQKTQKDLISELNKFENTSIDEKHINDKAKLFLRIRDIAGLQAAQLIHANKEYQSALEIIVNNFIQVGDNMKVISEMCGNIITDKKEKEVNLFNEINDKIASIEDDFKNRFNQNIKLNKDILLIEHQLEQSEIYFTVFGKLISGLDNNMELYLEKINKEFSAEKNVLESLNQVKDLFTEIKKNTVGLNDVTKYLNPVKKQIKSFIKEFEKLKLSTGFGEIREIVSKLNSFRQSLENKLKENHDISNQALESIKRSISEIKYYDFFENIIKEIIAELNTINYNLKVDESEEDSSIEANLLKLKKYYTMETEHKIHDQISKGEDMEIDINNDEDGDIEFF